MAGLQAVKRRITSVESTQKITNAMKLVASSKFRKAKEVYEVRKEFIEEITVSNDFRDMLSQLAKHYNINSFIEHAQVEKRLYIVITSDMGLCGGYNLNASKLAAQKVTENDMLITIGRKGAQYLHTKGFKIETEYEDIATDFKLGHYYGVATNAFDLLISGKVNAVSIIYTHFKNSVSFEPRVYDVYPITNEDKQQPTTRFECLEELDVEHLEVLAIEYLTGIFYGVTIESKMCEYASSRMAMENATDNAQEIKEHLLLLYNQKRQANITQEISEIVAGADAL